MRSVYPKIETLWNRDKRTFKVIPGEFRKPEFELIKRWLVTEKIDGTNIRILCSFPNGKVEIRGRTDNAQFRPDHLKKLEGMFSCGKVAEAFREDADSEDVLVVLYGELYGPKVQRGGIYRNDDVSFRLFDVRVGEWWLNWDNVEDVARKLGIWTVPVLERESDGLPTCSAELEDLLPYSEVALAEKDHKVAGEGIVARTDPLLCDRSGRRLLWKLKWKDWT